MATSCKASKTAPLGDKDTPQHQNINASDFPINQYLHIFRKRAAACFFMKLDITRDDVVNYVAPGVDPNSVRCELLWDTCVIWKLAWQTNFAKPPLWMIHLLTDPETRITETFTPVNAKRLLGALTQDLDIDRMLLEDDDYQPWATLVRLIWDSACWGILGFAGPTGYRMIAQERAAAHRTSNATASNSSNTGDKPHPPPGNKANGANGTRSTDKTGFPTDPLSEKNTNGSNNTTKGNASHPIPGPNPNQTNGTNETKTPNPTRDDRQVPSLAQRYRGPNDLYQARAVSRNTGMPMRLLLAVAEEKRMDEVKAYFELTQRGRSAMGPDPRPVPLLSEDGRPMRMLWGKWWLRERIG